MMLTLQNVSYTHPNKDRLFSHIQLHIGRQQKIALIGNNGAGKSTLLQLMAGILFPSEGVVISEVMPYYIPQLFGQFNHLTVAEALKIDGKLSALQQILAGDVTEAGYTALDDDWGIEERSLAALAHWKLHNISLSQPLGSLSGGQKTKVFLAGIIIHQPEIILLDEPSNHLDVEARTMLYDLIRSSNATIVMVSHDRALLAIPGTVYELDKHGLTAFGGNYEFYAAQKEIAAHALEQELKDREKALRKARETERETMERQHKLDARGKKKQEKAGVPTIMMNTLRNSAEKSTARTRAVHTEKKDAISQELYRLRKELPDTDKMKFDFDDAALHKGKILVSAAAINYSYHSRPLWTTPLSFQVSSGERIALKGANGSGKTTLIKLMLGTLQPTTGSISLADNKAVYIDQDYSLINNRLSVYEQAAQYNTTALQEHEIKIRLNRFLFSKDQWDKPCSTLSGGEKMRLMLCCLHMASQAPDIIIMDEPTNNLDIQNTAILTAAINDYKGTLIVISHDAYFLEAVNAERVMELDNR